MFGKKDTTRVEDTLSFIQTKAGEFSSMVGGVLNDIVNMVNTQFPRLTPSDRTAYSQLSTGELRRAIVLLWTVIGKKQDQTFSVSAKVDKAKTMHVDLQLEFNKVLLKAAATASYLGARYAFEELSQRPLRFIKAHPIMISGSTTGVDKFTKSNGDDQNILPFFFYYDAGHDYFKIQPPPPPSVPSHRFEAVSVPAVHWSDVPGVDAKKKPPYNFSGIRGCKLEGANFMVTTQFSGCVFNWTKHEVVIHASHVAPGIPGVPNNYPDGGTQLAQRLIENGDHANAGDRDARPRFNVFGSGAGNAPLLASNPEANPYYTPKSEEHADITTYIFGTKRAGVGWQLYVQSRLKDGTVMDARRIL